jgi:hypothetical protein
MQRQMRSQSNKPKTMLDDKKYLFYQTYLCNATLMSWWSKVFVLNDLYENWRIFKISFDLMNWVLVLINNFWTLAPQN